MSVEKKNDIYIIEDAINNRRATEPVNIIGDIPLAEGSATEDQQIATNEKLEGLIAAMNAATTAINNLIALIKPSDKPAAVNLVTDTTYSPALRQIVIGTGGSLKIDTVDSTGIVYPNLQDGQILDVQAIKIYSSLNGTSATQLVGHY